jgi:multidrug resistance efflux pump
MNSLLRTSLSVWAAVSFVTQSASILRAQQARRTEVRLPITLEADQRTELLARVEGYVAEVHVDIGDRVSKGQVLVSLQAPELEAEVRRRREMVVQAQANLAVAEGRVVIARANLRQVGATRDKQEALRKLRLSERDRYAALVRDGAVQEEKLEEAEFALMVVDAAVAKIDADVVAADADIGAAKNEVEFAKSGIEVAKAELAYAEAQDQLREIRSPFSGLVTARNLDRGQLVSPGNVERKPLLVVEKVDVLRGVMTVPANEATLIHVDDAVSLIGFGDGGGAKAPDGGQLRVSRVSQSLDKMTRTMRVEIDLKNDCDEQTGRYSFLSGQYGSASVKTK